MDKFTLKLLLILVTTLVSQIPKLLYADTKSEYQIKASFIYNLARFTEWPDDTKDLNLCIYGEDPFGSDIDNINGKRTNNRTIKIVRTQLIENVKLCHIVFLNIIPAEQHLFEKALNNTKGAHVLTVSDATDAIDFGVMIRIFLDGDKLAFDVNHTAAQASELKISSKLLMLARLVI